MNDFSIWLFLITFLGENILYLLEIARLNRQVKWTTLQKIIFSFLTQYVSLYLRYVALHHSAGMKSIYLLEFSNFLLRGMLFLQQSIENRIEVVFSGIEILAPIWLYWYQRKTISIQLQESTLSHNSVRMDFLQRKIQFNLYYIQYIHNARYTSLVEFTLRIIKATIYVRIMDDLKTDNYLHLLTLSMFAVRNIWDMMKVCVYTNFCA